MNKLETKYANIQKDFEQKKKEGERAEGVQNSLKTQVLNVYVRMLYVRYT
jgi:hypothetical protein